eukprot:scaffold85992_cov26-Tisochrysis_lutea.AAC.1
MVMEHAPTAPLFLFQATRSHDVTTPQRATGPTQAARAQSRIAHRPPPPPTETPTCDMLPIPSPD